MLREGAIRLSAGAQKGRTNFNYGRRVRGTVCSACGKPFTTKTDIYTFDGGACELHRECWLKLVDSCQE